MAKAESKSINQILQSVPFLALGGFLAAYALEVLLVPNHIIDGGVIGIGILIGEAIDQRFVYPSIILLNIPFLIIAYRQIAKTLVIQMAVALAFFTFCGHFIESSNLAIFQPYRGDLLEIVVIGGMVLGIGVGLIIRFGGCLDGTEILGLLVNKRYGFTVGSIVLAVNVIIFAIAGLVFQEWHAPIQSLITFFVVIKIMDMVITGLDEIKSVMVFSHKGDEVGDKLMKEMGLGLTVIHAHGGFTNKRRDVLYLMAERLQLSEIKRIVYEIDETAFVAIGNLHEVASGAIDKISSKV